MAAAKFKEDLAVDQTDCVNSLWAVSCNTTTDIQDRISSGVQCSGALEDLVKKQRISCVASVFHVNEVDIAIHFGIYRFYKTLFILFRIVEIHDLLGFLIPLYHRSLSGPTGAAPRRLNGSQPLIPNWSNGACGDVRSTVTSVIAIVATTETGDTRQSKVVILKGNRVFSGVTFHNLIIFNDGPLDSPITGLGRFYGLRN